jgi:3'-5' exoribonuclease
MKDFYLRDCSEQENKVITSQFVVVSKQIKAKKNGEPYLSLTLGDRSGSIDAKMWDNVEEFLNAFEQDDFVKIKGLINKYNNRWQLTIHKIRKVGDSEVQFDDYLPKTTKDIDELWRTLGGYVDSMQNPQLKELLQLFMNDEEIAKAYKCAPAAKTLHHAFIGGLLDHVVSLYSSCDLIVRNYPMVNRDLLFTGVFLHDIGKIHELTYARSFGYSTEGQLLGHMIIELEMLHKKIALIPDFSPELKILIEHLIISHHGQYEFGSPKLPMFPEALMLHYMDDLDSKMEAMRAQFEREAENESPWTSYNPSMARPLLNSKRFLEKPKAAEAEAPVEEKAPTQAPVTEVVAYAATATTEAVNVSSQSLLDLQSHFAAKKTTPEGK